ncbi:unnamed protein product [Pseudo-nitzschia multistriata]|uniref:SET domain-containing protein n=1 Tax=Pseudo-nitzschia multistriata TaxID=183589 RepID=A0A448YYQ2_9STRA|nr:unnamed protein product [Pseudo-nitzschia multistriata]
MGKNKSRRSNRDDTSRSDASVTSSVGGDDHRGKNTKSKRSIRINFFFHWLREKRQGILWILGCILVGGLFGFGFGTGWFLGEYGKNPSGWRIVLGGKIRSNSIYKRTIARLPTIGISENETIRSVVGVTGSILGIIPIFSATHDKSRNLDPFSFGAPPVVVRRVSSNELKSNPSHPYVYTVLREAIAREKGGYVHPDLGIMEPAPCGAARGIGMVRNLYHRCQTKCLPGIAEEKLEAKRKLLQEESEQSTEEGEESERHYRQEEVLIRVPLSYQMTRKVALDTLIPRITSEPIHKTLHELDDATLLTLLLAHERGVGQFSRWLPYIASLPQEPSCGYSQGHRPHQLDSINALRDNLGLEVDGWPGELLRASEYSERIVAQLANDYGIFVKHPKDKSPKANLRWALCQVASRAIGGSQKYGALRMVPLMDMLNHDFHAGGFVELTGKERLENGDFIDATNQETDAGAFVIRSLRHGRRKALRVGQELMVNYNVPHYSALDWMVSSGFVPPERYQNWQKLDAPLPRIRRDGPFAGIHDKGKEKKRRQESTFFAGFTSNKA